MVSNYPNNPSNGETTDIQIKQFGSYYQSINIFISSNLWLECLAQLSQPGQRVQLSILSQLDIFSTMICTISVCIRRWVFFLNLVQYILSNFIMIYLSLRQVYSSLLTSSFLTVCFVMYYKIQNSSINPVLMQQNYTELELGIQRILTQCNNATRQRRQILYSQIEGFVCLVHFHGEHNAEKLAFFSQIIDFYVEKYKLTPILYSGKAMAFLFNTKNSPFKNVYDFSVYTIEILFMLKLFSNSLHLDCSYAFGYGQLHLDEQNGNQSTQQQQYTGKILYDLYKISGCVLNKILFLLSKSDQKMFIFKKDQLNLNLKPHYNFVDFKKYYGISCMKVEENASLYHHLIKKLLAETSKTNQVILQSKTPLESNRNSDTAGNVAETQLSLFNLANRSSTSQLTNYGGSTFDSYSQNDSNGESANDICFTINQMKSYLSTAGKDSLIIDETLSEDDEKDLDLFDQQDQFFRSLNENITDQKNENIEQICSELSIIVRMSRIKKYFNNILNTEVYIKNLLKDNTITLNQLYQPNNTYSLFVYFASGIYVLISYKIFNSQVNDLFNINIFGISMSYQKFVSVMYIMFIFLTILNGLLILGEFWQWQERQKSAFSLKQKFSNNRDQDDDINVVDTDQGKKNDTTGQKINTVLPQIIQQLKFYASLVNQACDAINYQIHGYLLHHYFFIYELKMIMLVYIMIFMLAIVHHISFFLNAVSNFPINFFRNIKLVSFLIGMVAHSFFHQDIFQGIGVYLLFLQQLPIMIHIHSIQMANIRRQQRCINHLSEQFDNVTNITQLDDLTTRLLSISQQIPQLQKKITCNANVLYYQVHKFIKQNALFREVDMSKNQLLLLEILQSQINQFNRINYIIPIIDHGYSIIFRITLPFAGYQQMSTNSTFVSSQTALKANSQITASQEALKLPVCNNNVTINLKSKKSQFEDESFANYKKLQRQMSQASIAQTTVHKSVQLNTIANDIKVRHPFVVVQPPAHNFVQFFVKVNYGAMQRLLVDIFRYQNCGLIVFNVGAIYSFQIGLVTLNRALFGEAANKITQFKYYNYPKGSIICPDTLENRKMIKNYFKSFYMIEDGVLQIIQ